MSSSTIPLRGVVYLWDTMYIMYPYPGRGCSGVELTHKCMQTPNPLLCLLAVLYTAGKRSNFSYPHLLCPNITMLSPRFTSATQAHEHALRKTHQITEPKRLKFGVHCCCVPYKAAPVILLLNTRIALAQHTHLDVCYTFLRARSLFDTTPRSHLKVLGYTHCPLLYHS